MTCWRLRGSESWQRPPPPPVPAASQPATRTCDITDDPLNAASDAHCQNRHLDADFSEHRCLFGCCLSCSLMGSACRQVVVGPVDLSSCSPLQDHSLIGNQCPAQPLGIDSNAQRRSKRSQVVLQHNLQLAILQSTSRWVTQQPMGQHNAGLYTGQSQLFSSRCILWACEL